MNKDLVTSSELLKDIATRYAIDFKEKHMAINLPNYTSINYDAIESISNSSAGNAIVIEGKHFRLMLFKKVLSTHLGLK